MAVSRVQERIKMGGHAVPEATIRRRYHAGLRNFFNLYRPIADSWKLYDNSDANQFNLIASEVKGSSLHVEHEKIWQQLFGEYHGK